MGDATPAPEQLDLNSTTVLNLVAAAGLAVLYWLKRQPPDDALVATDPVCGMQVTKSQAATTLVADRNTYYFCSEGCRYEMERRLGKAG